MTMPEDDQTRAAASDAALAEMHTRFDEEAGLLSDTAGTIGYHTRIQPGTTVHPTSNSLDYALRLARTNDPRWHPRIARIVRILLPWQETNPVAATYGIWPWYVEEPLDKMSPPDWNWADFCGGHLLELLNVAPDCLPADLVANVDAAVGHAAWSIFRRNVGPEYTNIAISGAAVTLGAGARLHEPRLVDYGRRRIQALLSFTRETGGFVEYNSPNYAIASLTQLERLLRLATDAEARAAAEALHRLTWQWTAQRYHAATSQWAGPHSRSYSDRLGGQPLAFLRARTGLPLACHPALPDPLPETSPGLPCPDEDRACFSAEPAVARVIRQRFLAAKDGMPEVHGTTWLSATACLGTVSRGTMWYQTRPVIAYWRAPNEPAAVLRFRCLFDGRDLASGVAWCDQDEHCALVGFGFSTNRGVYHPYFDRPADGVFRGGDLRLRWQLDGVGATVHAAGPDAWDFVCGSVRARLRLVDGSTWDGRPVAVETSTEGNEVRVDNVLAASGCAFVPERARVAVAFSLEVLEDGIVPAKEALRLCDDQAAEWQVPGRRLRVHMPAGPSPTA